MSEIDEERSHKRAWWLKKVDRSKSCLPIDCSTKDWFVRKSRLQDSEELSCARRCKSLLNSKASNFIGDECGSSQAEVDWRPVRRKISWRHSDNNSPRYEMDSRLRMGTESFLSRRWKIKSVSVSLRPKREWFGLKNVAHQVGKSFKVIQSHLCGWSICRKRAEKKFV